MKSAFLALSLLLFTIAPAQAAPAPKWTVDQQASSIAFTGQHAGNDFKGSFKTWNTDIAFDPADLAASSVSVRIQTGSAATGDKTYDGSLPATEWLNVKAFPEAVFQTTSIRHIDGDAYEASGSLTIKDIQQDVILPFTLKIEGDTATMTGKVVLDRLSYEIGKASDAKAEWVSKDIGVEITLKAAKAQ